MAKTNLTFTKVGELYECEYTGDSGILQLNLSEASQVKVLGDAGIGYGALGLLNGQDIMCALNMDGIDKAKIVSYAPVVSGVVNSFES